MELVVDANVLFSALIAKGKTRELMMTGELSLVAPEFMLDEFDKHLDEISKKTYLSREVVEKLISELIAYSELKIVPSSEFESKISAAKRISPDPYDVPYFALALKLNCGIWSNDKKLKEQSEVKVYSTEDLLGLFK